MYLFPFHSKYLLLLQGNVLCILPALLNQFAFLPSAGDCRSLRWREGAVPMALPGSPL